MPTYDRIKLDIKDISPESASKVFQFLHVLLEEHSLDLNYFKNNLSNYSIGEQYFILKYAKSYFSNYSNSYLNNWLKSQDVENEIIKENSFFDLISTNSSNILIYIENNQKTTERQFKFYKKSEFDYLVGEEICYKIPLHTLPTKKRNDTELNSIGKSPNYLLEFKTKVFELFADILNEDQIKELFLNSFSFGRSDGRPTSLNFEFKNSEKIYKTFFELYQFYNSERNSLLRGKQILEKKKQDKVANTKRVRRKFAPQLLNNKITKLDIMKIMYNSFPQVRDNYKNFRRKKPLTTLDEYLLTKSRNIRKY